MQGQKVTAKPSRLPDATLDEAFELDDEDQDDDADDDDDDDEMAGLNARQFSGMEDEVS